MTTGLPSLADLPARAKDGSVRVVVESPRGSTSKLKYDEALGVFLFSRPLVLGLRYPFDWGFIPGTRMPDGDPLDAACLHDGATYPGVVIPSRALGLLRVEQNERGGKGRVRNDRIILSPVKSPRQEPSGSLGTLSERVRAEIEQFFVSAAAFEGKALEIKGWGNADEANELIDRSGTRTQSS